MDAIQLKDYFRSQVRDDVLPYLWSDAEVYRYMNEAQSMFARLTGGIYDVTSEATEVDVIPGEVYADLHPSILEIRQAVYIEPNGRRRLLKVIDLLSASKLTKSDYNSEFNIAVNATPGRVDYMVVGEEKNVARWVQVPEEQASVSLSIARLPLREVSEARPKLEIESRHHVNLIEWMKHLAYNKHDGDMFNPQASQESELRFRAYCDYVWREWERYRHTQKSVAYGGI